MKTTLRNLFISLNLLATPLLATTELTAWPAEAANQLNNLIKQHAFRGEYAVFDMDNTSYRYDLTLALLPYLEQKGLISRDKLPASLLPIPFIDQTGQRESLYSYYNRLCEIDDLVCYPWIAQAFTGLSLATLKSNIDEMLTNNPAIPVTYFVNGQQVKEILYPPQFFRGMQQLYNKLQENDIQIYVMTAASEELVRMVASDPKYGYNVKPENVIGVNTLLRDPHSNTVTTSRLQIKQGTYDPQKNLSLELTSFLINPMTWYEGKAGSILGWIDQWKKPILVAGDTPLSDGFMLLNSTDISKEGIRLWINKSQKDLVHIQALQDHAALQQQQLGLPVDAQKNWLVVTPEQIQ